MHESSHPPPEDAMAGLEISYPLDDFLTDFRKANRGCSKPSPSHELPAWEYFRHRYGETREALDRMMRCLAAGSYLEENREELNLGALSVVGESKALVSGPVLFAAWVLFCQKKNDPKTFKPDIVAFKEYCVEIHSRHP